jgi:hypothetical protein
VQFAPGCRPWEGTRYFYELGGAGALLRDGRMRQGGLWTSLPTLFAPSSG